MPVMKDESGRRSVQAEVEVPGSPEEVWKAIATGEGVSAWFVPAEVDERVGGKAICHFSPDGTMDSVATIETWEPPHRFVATTEEGPGPVATEWAVEARSGSTCLVRVVHSWFAQSDDWDKEFEGHTYGWQSFFRILRLYATHFLGQRGRSFQEMVALPEPRDEAWTALLTALGLGRPQVGERIRTSEGLPLFVGTVEWAGVPLWPEDLLIRVEEPVAGLAHWSAHPMGGQVFLALRFYCYGEDIDATVAEWSQKWHEWLAATFPAAGPS